MFIRIASALLITGLLAASTPNAQAQTTKKKVVAKKTTTTKKTTVKAPVKKTTAVTPPAAPVITLASLTQTDASGALKDALTKGTGKAVEFASAIDGYNTNDDIHIAWPDDAALMKMTLSKIPGTSTLVDAFETQLNRAAEAAAPMAKDIFVNAITNISFTDALSLISSSQNDAATQFLKKTTYSQLTTAFHPSIQTALDQVEATKAYAKMTGEYNRIPLVTPVQTNLADYTTNKAVDGLFVLLAQQEAKIRQNPSARTTDLMKKVFGAVK